MAAEAAADLTGPAGPEFCLSASGPSVSGPLRDRQAAVGWVVGAGADAGAGSVAWVEGPGQWLAGLGLGGSQ